MKNKPERDAIKTDRPRPSRQTWVLVGLSGFFLFLASLLFVLRAPVLPWLPVHLHSILAADYSQDPRGQPVAQINLSIIYDLLRDLSADRNNPGDASPDERYSNVIDQLLTPVPTITAMPGTIVFVPTAKPQTTDSTTATTDSPATLTPTQHPTGTLATTATIGPTSTPTYILTFVTATHRPPTQQPPMPTNTRPPAITQTATPPTQAPTQPLLTATPRPSQPPTPSRTPTRQPYPPPYP